MNTDIKKIIKLTILILIPIIILYLLLVLFYSEKATTEADCSKIDSTLGMKYDLCYNSIGKEILFSMTKFSNNNVKGAIKMPFSEDSFETPEYGKTVKYKFKSEANPGAVSINQIASINFQICNNSVIVQIEQCSEEQIELSADFSETNKTIKVEPDNRTKPSNVVPIAIAKGKTFELTCKSEWACNPWEECISNIQKRQCYDKNLCLVSTDIPELEKPCNECLENWKCIWSDCSSGYSTPDCIDLNGCGTSYSKPKKIECNSDCTPNIVCSTWSKCQVDYNFKELGKDQEVSGIRSRLCEDRNSCINSYYEKESCSLKILTYSKEVTICGKNYIETYESSTNTLLSRVRNDFENNLPDISVIIDSSEIVCDSCTNNMIDLGEQGVDCGGNCKPCKVEQYEKGFTSNFITWIKDLF